MNIQDSLFTLLREYAHHSTSGWITFWKCPCNHHPNRKSFEI